MIALHMKTLSAPPNAAHLARIVLAVFLVTFILSRVLVYLIMARRVPDMFLHLGGTHVHHLNYGIFLLSIVGAILIFVRPTGRTLIATAIAYAIGLTLTFDEFGMWLHLGGSYWQRASYDAIVVIAAVLGLIAAAPSIKRFHPRHWVTAAILIVLLTLFGILLIKSLDHIEQEITPRLESLETQGPQ